MAHDEAPGVAIGGEAVVLAAVDLHLVLIEAMDEIARPDADRQVEALRVIDGEGRVRQARSLVLRDRRLDMLARQPAPDGRQTRQQLAVAVALRELRRREMHKAIGAGELAIERVEAAVLGIKDDDCVDLGEGVRRCRTGHLRQNADHRGGEARHTLCRHARISWQATFLEYARSARV